MKKEPNIIFKFVIPLLLIFLFSGRSLAADVKLLTNQEYLSLLQDKIRTAREEILVSMYLFRTSENERNLSTRLRADLISAASRGVKVSVLLEV
ncbi:MAG: phospholipase D/Transphosphatidylase [Deltaproteobacteria bacterium]|nr:phospholipase D/Transphosphatidylase [Deltaproteobacteria bacterium]